MIHDFWWRLCRNLNRASHSCSSKELRSTQGTTQVHLPPWLTGPLQQPAQGPLSLLLFLRSHSPLYRHRDPLQTWVLSHRSHDQSLSDSPALPESNSDFYKVLQGFSWPAPMASLPHPLPLPPFTPSAPAPWFWLLLKHTRLIFGSLCSRPLYFRVFPRPSKLPESPSLSFFTTLITIWHRIFPSSLSVSLIDSILFHYVLFTSVPLHQEICLLGQNHKYLMNSCQIN